MWKDSIEFLYFILLTTGQRAFGSQFPWGNDLLLSLPIREPGCFCLILVASLSTGTSWKHSLIIQLRILRHVHECTPFCERTSLSTNLKFLKNVSILYSQFLNCKWHSQYVNIQHCIFKHEKHFVPHEIQKVSLW